MYCLDVFNSITLVSLEYSTFLLVQAMMGDYIVDALVDNGVSFNFIGLALEYKVRWQYLNNRKITLNIADGSIILIQLACYR